MTAAKKKATKKTGDRLDANPHLSSPTRDFLRVVNAMLDAAEPLKEHTGDTAAEEMAQRLHDFCRLFHAALASIYNDKLGDEALRTNVLLHRLSRVCAAQVTQEAAAE